MKNGELQPLSLSQTLRIGVCSCTNYYKGKLTGETIDVKKLRGTLPPKSRNFVIAEVIIDEDHFLEIGDRRIHFLLDAHLPDTDQYYRAFLHRIQRVKHRKEYGGVKLGFRLKDERRWKGHKPATINQIKTGIRNSLQMMTMGQLDWWLRRTSSL